MLESTSRSTLYHVYNRRYGRSCKKVFDLDFQGHAIKIEFFHYHRWIPWPRKHTHEKYFWKIRTGRPKSRGGVVPTPPLGVRRWIFTLGICGLKMSIYSDNKCYATKTIATHPIRNNSLPQNLYLYLSLSLSLSLSSLSLSLSLSPSLSPILSLSDQVYILTSVWRWRG